MAEGGSEGNEILEGFLCPVCHKDLRSPSNLISHFEVEHREEQDLLKSLKGLVGKAKKKILKVDEQSLESFRRKLSESDSNFDYVEPQDPGFEYSHTEYFKSVRRDRLDHRTTETNKLIIRLDKLLKCDGSDRKQKEQEQVMWLDGSTVTRCPSCASSFNIARRQHHCRLCGSIMCNSCSKFLPFETARSITTAIYSVVSKPQEVNSKSDSHSFRLCVHCMQMLENRMCIQKLQTVRPTIAKLYSNLRKIKLELQPSLDMYEKMHNSLTTGDTTYLLQDAQSLRSAIAQQGEALDAISKQIASLPGDPETPKLLPLQNAIRRATYAYIKNCIVALPELPKPSDLERIRKERILRNYETPQNRNSVVNVKKVAVTTGWSPDNFGKEVVPEDDDDPLMQQIQIVRGFIEQAKNAKRFEEVASLRKNLQDLKSAYQQQSKMGYKKSSED